MNDKNKSPIKVTIYIPEKIPEAVRQRKINIIYDILSKCENTACNCEPNTV